ncbi:(d)CMP kinase [Mycoplasma simbae]|uniref:(d)CMP kinase n=1 Tax=Mycoplasma simbae TaxID=36744 RepID=UPI000497D4A1|nr:(d)CMP kinase [Mycoplasma simbae]
MNKINVAIDGPSGAGKSTVSQAVASKIGYTFLSSGSVYRAIAYILINRGINYTDEQEVRKHLQDSILQISIDEKQRIFTSDQDISTLIRSDEVSKVSSNIAVYKDVRQYVVDFIQRITKASKGYIMDGRDTTYRIMPHAEVKIYLTASACERAHRRILQNEELGFNTDFEEVLKEVEARDLQDTNRTNDPLKIVEDAHVIDCTKMSFEQVVDEIIKLIKAKSDEK